MDLRKLGLPFISIDLLLMTSITLKKLSSPSIDPVDPWSGDILDRRRFGQVLSEMIEGISQPYVISLKGDWGSGKSVFLKRLEADLEGRAPRVPVIFVDAWKYDYYEDPLYSLVSAIELRLLQEQANRGNDRASAIEVGKRMFGYAGKVIAPLAKIAGATVDAVTHGAASAFAEGVGELGQALFDANQEKRNAHQKLSSELEDARDHLLGLDRDGVDRSTQGAKVVVIIDELDRCRPDYAIRLLERVKHFFDLRGYLFVIAVDGANLQDAVRTLYGPTVDGERYLRKFFDLELYLPDPDVMSFNKFLRHSFGVMEMCKIDDKSWPSVLKSIPDRPYSAGGFDRSDALLEASAYFEHIAFAFELKLRDQAQAYSRLYAAVAALGNRPSFMPIAAAFIVCLRYFDHESYERWRTTGATPGVEGLDAQCTWANVVSKHSPVVAHVLRSYLAIAAQNSAQMIDQTIRLGFKDKEFAPELERRLPNDGQKWPKLFAESHRDVFLLATASSE